MILLLKQMKVNFSILFLLLKTCKEETWEK